MLADKPCDSNANRLYYADNAIQVIIPSRPNRLEPVPLDEEAYKDCNQVERFFSRMKQYRRLATRYDKTSAAFLGFWYLAAALDWLI
ncbi:transposase [Hymenobacter rubripertinctus]|uniref:transposase n=1 Tax=Hymenobacter rubripertinctus TaxID=2029981 RepID=UPI0016016844|nr:transposase [Hymenobacter rubripertinctus]